MASPSQLFSELTAVSLPKRRRTITDTITEHNAFYRELEKKGNIRTDNGGTQIEEPIYYDTFAVQNYSGFQRNDVGHKQVITNVKYDWVQKWLAVSASGYELNVNSGETAMIKLVKARIKAAEISAANHMAVEVYGDGAISSSIYGLQAQISQNGLGVVGGVDASVTPVWANQYYGQLLANFGPTTIRNDFDKLWISTVRGTMKPKMILCNHDVFTALEASMEVYSRYMKPEMADAGFEQVGYKGVQAIFDANVNFANQSAGGTPTAYFLNPETHYMFEHPKARWQKQEARTPVDQDGIAIPFLWMGNMAITSRRDNGIYFAA